MDTLSDDKIRTTLSRNLFSYIADRIPRGIDTISSNKNDVTASLNVCGKYLFNSSKAGFLVEYGEEDVIKVQTEKMCVFRTSACDSCNVFFIETFMDEKTDHFACCR